MTAPFTPEQEARVREIAAGIAATMIAQALHGAGDRIAEAINDTIVRLPVLHIEDVTHVTERDHV